MYTDLILFNNKDNNLGFSKYIKVDIIKAHSIMELEKRINKSQQGVIIIESSSLNRSILENKKVDLLVSTENIELEDSLHYRNSGLNQVLCKLANKNDIAIAFNFNNLLKSKGIERSTLLGKMAQNVRLCRKYKVNMVIASFASNKFELKSTSDLISFGIVLGMTPREAKESLMNINALLEQKKSRITNGLKAVD